MDGLQQALSNLGYSLRRYYVDRFFLRHIGSVASGARALDLGGEKVSKRGRFDIGRYDVDVVYLNISPRKSPDVLGDMRQLPFASGSFDVVICAEVLEHVPDPAAVMAEAYRVLRRDGVLLACVPFLFRMHDEPHDFGRYTDHYWRRVLEGAGFRTATAEKHGLFWSVFADMVRGHAEQLLLAGRFSSRIGGRAFARAITWWERRAIDWDARPGLEHHRFYGTYTTGFGIRALK